VIGGDGDRSLFHVGFIGAENGFVGNPDRPAGGGQFNYGRIAGLNRGAVGTCSGMAKLRRIRLLEVRVVPVKPNDWEWQVCEGETPIAIGFATSRESAQIKGDTALFKLLSMPQV
jgi:hypothetical protein